MTEYWFKDEGYWVSNGCDCCEPDYFECYNYVGLDENDYLVECSGDIPYSCTCQMDAKVAVLHEYYKYDSEMLYNCTEEELDYMLSYSKACVMFMGEE